MFVSKNEAGCFSYQDSVIREFSKTESGIFLLVDALIVEPQNSQNTNFTRSYADTAKISFEEGTILRGIKEGCKRYDANDKLLEEIPDAELQSEELDALLAGLSGQYLYDMKEAETEGEERSIMIGIEMSTDDITGVDADSYQVLIKCRNMTVSWDRYMNRVSQ